MTLFHIDWGKECMELSVYPLYSTKLLSDKVLDNSIRRDIFSYVLGFMAQNNYVNLPDAVLQFMLQKIQTEPAFLKAEKSDGHSNELSKLVYTILDNELKQKSTYLKKRLPLPFLDSEGKPCQIIAKRIVPSKNNAEDHLTGQESSLLGIIKEIRSSLILLQRQRFVNKTKWKQKHILFQEGTSPKLENFTVNHSVCIWDYKNVLKRHYFNPENCFRVFQEVASLLAIQEEKNECTVQFEDSDLYDEDAAASPSSMGHTVKMDSSARIQELSLALPKKNMSETNALISYAEYKTLLQVLLACQHTCGISDGVWKKIYQERIIQNLPYTALEIAHWMCEEGWIPVQNSDPKRLMWVNKLDSPLLDQQPPVIVPPEIEAYIKSKSKPLDVVLVAPEVKQGLYIQHSKRPSSDDDMVKEKEGQGDPKRLKVDSSLYETYMSVQNKLLAGTTFSKELLDYVRHDFAPQMFSNNIQSLLNYLQIQEFQLRMYLQIALHSGKFPVRHLQGVLDPSKIHLRNKRLWTPSKMSDIDEDLNRFQMEFVPFIFQSNNKPVKKQYLTILKNLYCAHWTFIKNPKRERIDTLYLHLYDLDFWTPLLLTVFIPNLCACPISDHQNATTTVTDYLQQPLDASVTLPSLVSSLPYKPYLQNTFLKTLAELPLHAKYGLFTYKEMMQHYVFPLQLQQHDITERYDAASELDYQATIHSMRKGCFIPTSTSKKTALLSDYLTQLSTPPFWKYLILSYIPSLPSKLSSCYLWLLLFFLQNNPDKHPVDQETGIPRNMDIFNKDIGVEINTLVQLFNTNREPSFFMQSDVDALSDQLQSLSDKWLDFLAPPPPRS